VAGAADDRILSYNTKYKEWVCADITAWTAGKVSVIISGAGN